MGCVDSKVAVTVMFEVVVVVVPTTSKSLILLILAFVCNMDHRFSMEGFLELRNFPDICGLSGLFPRSFYLGPLFRV